MPKTQSTRQLQAKAAAAKRWNRDDHDEIARDYATQRLAEYIEKILAEAPPLTDDQRTKLTDLFRGPLGDGLR